MGKNFKALMTGLQYGGRNLLGSFVLLPDALKVTFKNPNFSKTKKGKTFLGIFVTVAVKLTPPGAAAFFVVDTIKGTRRERKNLVLNEMGTAMNLRDRGFSGDGAAKLSTWLCEGNVDAINDAVADGQGISSSDAELLMDMLHEAVGEDFMTLDEIYQTPRKRQVPTRLPKKLNPFYRRRINQEQNVGY